MGVLRLINVMVIPRSHHLRSCSYAVTGLSTYDQYQIGGRNNIRDKRITMIRMVTGTHEALDICGRFVVQNTKLAGNRFRRIT
mmetsp:Transcript_14960/g.22508  ORF Transcript_14960/g.22508 Transcript_14960/m.22508 type:complete len:83 (+) Transcript_14960:197-445(+)